MGDTFLRGIRRLGCVLLLVLLVGCTPPEGITALIPESAQASGSSAAVQSQAQNASGEASAESEEAAGRGTVTGADVLSGNLPAYAGTPYIEINNGIPDFDPETEPVSFERYSELDDLGRCGMAMACIGQDLMPDSPREAIGMVRPSGWHLVKYEEIDGGYLYNRCHLIGYQLTGENANEGNLLTGTRYMNTQGMLPFENRTASYIRRTGNHVLYRATPVFYGDNLLAGGVWLEALSLEDGGTGVRFSVFVYNVQPGIHIDYSNGDSRRAEDEIPPEPHPAPPNPDDESITYVLNTGTLRFHLPDCPSVQEMNEKNRQYYTGDRESLIQRGYQPCGRCKP